MKASILGIRTPCSVLDQDVCLTLLGLWFFICEYYEKKCNNQRVFGRKESDGAYPILPQEQLCTHRARFLLEVYTEIARLHSALLSDRNGKYLLWRPVFNTQPRSQCSQVLWHLPLPSSCYFFCISSGRCGDNFLKNNLF